MSKYRDTDEVLEQIRKKLGIKSLSYLLEAERQIVDVIQSAPSIDIVFCKECKYEKRCTTNVHFLADNGLDVIPVHFCSYGEREGE